MFAKAKAARMDLAALGEQLKERKATLQQQGGRPRTN